VVTNAAVGDPGVKALVYVDAFIPDQDETLLQLVSAQPGSCLGGNPANVFNFVPIPGGGGDVDTYIKPSLVPSCFASGLPADQAAVIAATQRPLAASALQEPSGAPAWKSIPSWAVIGTTDQVIPPAELTFMAQRAGARITRVHAGHLSMIADPGTVAAVIERAARATS
jgi:pimeloyl-ACP methyl ester carboxylesterase